MVFARGTPRRVVSSSHQGSRGGDSRNSPPTSSPDPMRRPVPRAHSSLAIVPFLLAAVAVGLARLTPTGRRERWSWF